MMSFENAIRILNSRRARAQSQLKDMKGSDDMDRWLELLGYSQLDLGKLNVIHVAGTNGKGSTCAYIASILQNFGCKVGLYTSPHLLSICERIRINGKPIEDDEFAKYFFEIWYGLPSEASTDMDIPRYLQLLTLLSFHVFIREQVDVAVFETHMGGEVDATNIVASPVVTAVTCIGEDHVKFLGPTIEDIAWHKAGIFKAGCPAFSAPQAGEVAQVLMQRAKEKTNVKLSFVEPDPSLDVSKFQVENCSLAREVALEWISRRKPDLFKDVTENVNRAIQRLDWHGRYQQIKDGENHRWFLDGAHNELGISTAVKWFSEISRTQSINSSPVRMIIFSHFSDRNGVKLLEVIHKTLVMEGMEIQHMIFTTYNERDNGQTRIDRNLTSRSSMPKLDEYAESWREYQPGIPLYCEVTIESALKRACTLSQNHLAHVLITGSLHLVSGALSILRNKMI